MLFRPKLSVVVVFFNMQREAQRTLYSLDAAYQHGIRADEYEIIAVDSGSSTPLNPGDFRHLTSNIRFLSVAPSAPTPCEAMNVGIQAARGQFVACAIDGARMLSPGVLSTTLQALRCMPHGVVCTLGMHLGPKRQTLSISEGYGQTIEDTLLETCQWQDDGYRLFDISVPAGSSQRGFLHPINESNFFTIKRQTLLRLGGFDESFKSAGGGLVNLDMHNRMLQNPAIEPIMLLGEASFHQFHGGVSTNVPADRHPLAQFKDEYQSIRGHAYVPVTRNMTYFGRICEPSRRFLDWTNPD